MTHIFLLKSSREKIPFPNDELLWPAKPILKLVPRRHRDPRHDMTSILFGSIPAKLRKAANDDVLRAQSARTWSRLCNDGGSTEMDASSFFFAALCFVQLKVTRSSHDLGWEHHKVTILFLLVKFEKCENVVAFSTEPLALQCLEPAKFDRIDNEKFLWPPWLMVKQKF